VYSNHLVTQSNDLIEARQTHPLNAREQKIILSFVSMIQPNDADFKKYEMYIKDFHEMLGLEGREHYTQIKEIVKNLMSKVIEIPYSNGDYLLANWASSVKYRSGEGKIEFTFSPDLKPYLLQLKKAFTSYRLSNILSLKSVYSIRLYELMKKWQHIGRWEVPIESLREKLGAITKTYELYGNLKSRVLNPAVKEVNEKTDVQVLFKEIRKGRKVIKIEFTIKHCKEKELTIDKPEQPKQPQMPTEQEEMFNRLNKLTKGYNFDQIYFTEIYKVAEMIWEDKAESELEYLIRYVNEEDSVKSPLGFIKSKLREVYNLDYAISFADLKPSQKKKKARTESIPDWLNEQNEQQPEIQMTEEDLEKQRRLLERQKEFKRERLVKQGLSPEEIEKELEEM